MSTLTTHRWIVPFSEGRAEDRSLLGGNGANPCEMTRIGLPVPPGFIVTTDADAPLLLSVRSVEEEREALVDLERQQQDDFEALFEVMDGKRAVVRLLDPPLHGFLPDVGELRVKEAKGELRPEVYRAQVRAVLRAAAARKAAGGTPPSGCPGRRPAPERSPDADHPGTAPGVIWWFGPLLTAA